VVNDNLLTKHNETTDEEKQNSKENCSEQEDSDLEQLKDLNKAPKRKYTKRIMEGDLTEALSLEAKLINKNHLKPH
jgi:hypothetical protein